LAQLIKQYEIYQTKAVEDLNAAKYLLDGYNFHNLEIKLEIIFFHLQQCAEKLLKAILDLNNIKFPKIHDLEELIELCKSHDIVLFENIEIIVDLTDYAVEGRYSVIHDDLQNVDRYIEIIDKLSGYVKMLVKAES
jgi:HEPN domain-containing protein